jgi:hypothetical protein
MHAYDALQQQQQQRHLYRGINEFKRSYQPRNNLVNIGNGDLLADSHNILNRWKNYFSHLLNVHNVSDVRQREFHTDKRLISGPSPRFEAEIAVAKLKKHKSSHSSITDSSKGRNVIVCNP